MFDFDYAEIALIVDKSPVNCRQIATRARTRVAEPARSRPPRETEERLVMAYADAISRGDVDALVRILADDVVLWSDGGGKAKAARHPLVGAQRVAKFLVGVNRQVPAGTQVSVARVNGILGFTAHLDGSSLGVVAFDIAHGQIAGIRVVLNPDKLIHLHLI